MGIKSTFIEFYKRAIDYDKALQIYSNGEYNDYPERIERLINNSVTAKQCANTMATFLSGKGFVDHNTFKVGKQTLLTALQKASKSVSRQRGVFFHVNYNLNWKITSIEILPYTHCRVGKKDDNKYHGKIAVSENWSDVKKNPPQLIDIFNPDPKVVQAQVMKCQGNTLVEKIKNYKGQVYFISLDYNTIYPYSTIDAVQKDCDSEAQAGIYKNSSLRKGFFGKTLVITRPLVDAPREDVEMWTQQDNERENFKRTIKSFIGAENTDGVLHLEMEFDDTNGIEKSILFKTIETNIDDKLFEFTERSTRDNIRFSFNNIPAMLVHSNDGQMFGQSGEGIKQAKLFYQEQTTMERMALEEAFNYLMRYFEGFTAVLTIEPLIQEDVNQQV